MKSDSGKSISLWMQDVSFPQPALLEKNEKIDVCIIGAGIAGLTSAYLLSREGKSVLVIDDGPIAGGETCRTTAHLTNVMDERFLSLEKLHGAEGARLAAESHTQAIDLIESIVKKEKIDCDFERLDGYLCFGTQTSLDVLNQEYQAALRAGMQGVEEISQVPLKYFESGPALKFKRQAQFHPLKYLDGLRKCLIKNGVRIFKAHAEKVEGGSSPHVFTADGFKITASSVIVATNTPFNNWVVIHTKQAAYRTYVIGARIPRGSVTRALYWDTEDPYHYIRLQNLSSDSDLLIIGGEDHKTGQPPKDFEPYQRLEEWTRERFLMIEKIEFRWSGQVMQPVDGLAFIGRNPMDQPNVYIATGDAGQGMTHGTIAGILLTDLIFDRKNPWEKLYDPSRKTLGSLGNFVCENTNVATQYIDWLSGGDVSSVEEIKPGSGAIVRKGLEKIAVYREKNGSLLELCAACPHLGGIVSWNKQESTWDCPCHGSRFDIHGKVINGPATSDLKKLIT